MNIAIIGQNGIFRDSLRILLNQVDDFNIVFDSGEVLQLLYYQDISSVDVVLFDSYAGTENFRTLINKANELSSNIKFLVLTDTTRYYFWQNQKLFPIEGIILKDSGKEEFEIEIRSLKKN